MSEIWGNAPLSDFCSFISGSGFPEHLQGRDNGELPFYKVSDMSSLGNERFLLNANNYVSRELARKRSWKTAPASAVVFAKVGAALLLNRRRMLSTESIIDNNMVAVVANEFTTNDWLYWQLLRVDFADFVQDGALPSINQRQLGEIPIPKVSATEALKICEILDTLDTAIHETEAIIAKLKAVKQGLLHDLLTRGIDASGELRPPQAEEPNLYKESPLGWIPKEWGIKPLSEYTASEITYGIVQAGPHIPNGVPYIRTGDMSGDSLVRETMLCTSKRIANSYARSEVRTGDLVMAIRATVGKVLPVPNDLNGANLTQGTARISPNTLTDGNFLLWAIRHSRVQKAIQLEIKGTTFAEITLGALRQVPVAAPFDIEEQREIGRRLTVIDEQLQSEQAYFVKTHAEKSGLMDDLLTGRVRVTPLLEGSAP